MSYGMGGNQQSGNAGDQHGPGCSVSNGSGASRGGRGGGEVDSALAAGNWSGAMDAAFGPGDWGMAVVKW